MARSIDQVLAEVTARSDPQRQLVLNQISQLPTQQAADEASLAAKKDQAYEDILGGARRRGLGFSGIPLGEQAKYNATDYAPAVANLKSTYGGRKATLESALTDIGKNDYSTAYDIFNQDRAFEEGQRQFNAQHAASQVNPFAGLFGGNSAPQQSTQVPQVDPQTQTAYNDVQNLLSKDPARIQREYEAIKKSAGFGNPYDKIKLSLIEQLYPSIKQNPLALKPSSPTLVPLQPTKSTGLTVGSSNIEVLGDGKGNFWQEDKVTGQRMPVDSRGLATLGPLRVR
jgi:hypothetical protein